MLSLVVLANKVLSDIGTKDKAIAEALEALNIRYEINYVTTKSFNALNDIKNIVAEQDNRYLIVLADDTNKNSQIYVGLDNIRGESVLLLDIDTNIEVVKQLLQKYKDGCQNVYVRKKENPVLNFFVKLGSGTYTLGLKMLKKITDICCESSVVLLNAQSVDTILSYPQASRALLNTNLTSDQKFGIVATKEIHDSPTHAQLHPQKWLASLGGLSLLFIIVSLGALFFYPMFNGWVYSLWMFITIVLWLALGAVACVIASKLLFDARQGTPIPLDVDGIPFVNIMEAFTHFDLMFANTEKQPQDAKAMLREKVKNSKTKATKTKRKTADNKKSTEKQKTSSTSTKKRGRPPKKQTENKE